MANVQCWVCFGYGHTGKNCPKGKGKGGGKKGGKGKGKGGFKGKSKGKGKSFNSMEDETAIEDVYGTADDGAWENGEEYPGFEWNDDVEDWVPAQGHGNQDFGGFKSPCLLYI